MSITYNESIEWLLKQRRSKRELGNFLAFLEKHGNPHQLLKSIHVAGTNGKGSTTNDLRAILQEEGYRVGTFTSPHLEKHHDRIRINDVAISDEELTEYIKDYQVEWEECGLSMFEIDFFIACLYFLRHQVDYAVIEVGLGGTYDATNVITPLVSIITNISFDHMQYLGNTIEEIADAKAGIIKEGVPCVTHVRDEKALEVIQKKCEEKNARCILVDDAKIIQEEPSIHFDYQDYKDIELPTIATYQVENASTALECIFELRRQGIEISDSSIYEGLKKSTWAGRFELIHSHPKIYLDGAHNLAGIDALCETLKKFEEPYRILFAACKDKETDTMVEKLLELGHEVMVSEFEYSRSETAENLAKNHPVIMVKDWREAIDQSLQEDTTLIVTGSLYFISDVRYYCLYNLR